MKKLHLIPAFLLLSVMHVMAQTTNITANVSLQSWSEPITVFNDDQKPWTTQNNQYVDSPAISNGETTTLTVNVNATTVSTFCFDAYQWASVSYQDRLRSKVEVIVDNTTWCTLNSAQLNLGVPRMFIDLTAGQHTIKFVVTNDRTNGSKHNVRIGLYGLIKKDVQVHAVMTEPGSLGQEILYFVESLSDVNRLKITGTLNDADWTTIGNMATTLWELDLSEITNTSIPNERFYNNNDTSWPYLHKMVLPAGIKSIGSSAFRNSFISEMLFPDGLETIGNYAFLYSRLQSAILPDSYCSTNSTTASTVFANCRLLHTFYMGNNVKVLNTDYISGCISLTGFTLPASVVQVYDVACCNCWNNDFGTLSSVETIGRQAFSWTAITNIKLDNLKSMGRACFDDNLQLTSAELGEQFYRFSERNDFTNIPNLTTFKINSPTVCAFYETLSDAQMGNITLKVPNYLVNSYKSHGNWLKMQSIEGFSTVNAQWLHIQDNLTMGARQRMEGRPNIHINNNLIFKIGGEALQQFGEVKVHANRLYEQFTQIISTCPDVDITTANVCQYTYKDRWYPLCLPYDVKVSSISPETGSYAIRYYDGANRAANGATGSWKDYAPNDVIPAGTGFIYQASNNDVLTQFPSNGTSGNKLFSPNTHTTPLQQHASEGAANQSWNLVGNPYQCYYDAKKMNFNAPITIITPDAYGNVRYTAYSLADDDYILRPNEAFFVQCPVGIQGIAFSLSGKQTVSTVIAAGAGSKALAGANSRALVDLTISNKESSDRTRVVMNEDASAEYEMACDAGKFFGDGLQVYSIGADRTSYAINERPQGDGLIPLGFIAPTDGAYTLTLTRNSASSVSLIDQQLGTEVNIADAPYTFNTDKGSNESRFILRINNELTALHGITSPDTQKNEIYDISGRPLGKDAQSLKRGVYLIDGRKVYVK